jgi:hypothetical protein
MVTGTLETLEERLTSLEREMAQVKERLAAQNTQPANPWLDHVYGAFKDDPLFEEAVRYGREWRESQNRMDDEDNVSDGHG